MRIPIIAGNWKMHKTLTESVDFVKALAPELAPYTGVERVVDQLIFRWQCCRCT